MSRGDGDEDWTAQIAQLEEEIASVNKQISETQHEIDHLRGQLRPVSDEPTFRVYPRITNRNPEIVEAFDRIAAIIHAPERSDPPVPKRPAKYPLSSFESIELKQQTKPVNACFRSPASPSQTPYATALGIRLNGCICPNTNLGFLEFGRL
jgi:TolA-binding protein